MRSLSVTLIVSIIMLPGFVSARAMDVPPEFDLPNGVSFPADFDFVAMPDPIGRGISTNSLNGKPVIYYDPVKVQQMPPVVRRFALFHELGHQRLGHTEPNSPYAMNRQQCELDADTFAVKTLWRVDPHAVAAAAQDFERQGPSGPELGTHPTGWQRAANIRAVRARLEGRNEGDAAPIRPAPAPAPAPALQVTKWVMQTWYEQVHSWVPVQSHQWTMTSQPRTYTLANGFAYTQWERVWVQVPITQYQLVITQVPRFTWVQVPAFP
jgi:hypothetical protein